MTAGSTKLSWRGDLSGARINQRYSLRKRRRGHEIGRSDRYKATIEEMALSFRQQWKGGPLVGPVAASIVVYWQRTHREGPAEGEAFVDVDACVKGVLDALEEAEVVSDDAQVCKLVVEKRRASFKMVTVKVGPWDDRKGEP